MTSRLLHPGWTLLLPFLALTALILCPPERRLWMALLSSSAYALLQWMLPKCRLRIEHYFCPVNIALLLFLLKIVAVPGLIMFTGAESRVLSFLPSFATMEGAILVDILAYSAFCLGLTLAPSQLDAPLSGSLAAALSRSPSVAFNWIFGALGLVGFAAAFGSIGRILLYFTQPEEMAIIQKEQDGTLQGLVGTILRPFLAFALVAWWSRVADEHAGQASWRPVVVGLLAALGITLANLTFSFNRAAFMFPLICLAAVYSARIRRIPIGASASVLAAILPVLIAIGNYRSAGAHAPAASAEVAFRETSENIQAYATGPQYTGIFYDQIQWGTTLYGGTTVLASVMSPVPILGKSFRDTSGPALFNHAIYGRFGVEDQIIPFATELFANFHAPGVLAGFILLGLFLSYAERLFNAAQSMFASFAIQYIALWGAMLSVWSLSIYSQILIYFFVPIYFYLAVLLLRDWLRGFNRQPHLPLGVTP